MHLLPGDKATMASKNRFDSDSDNTFITEVSEKHKPFMKSKLMQYISDMKDFSVHILHSKGKPAKLVFDIGSKGKSSSSTEIKQSNTIIVKNIPSSYDELHLRMFFEYEKEKGGGPVKSVSLSSSEHSAIIEFEEAKAVDVVLGKKPIKIMGQTVEVEEFHPYLSEGEVMRSLSISGTDVNKHFSQDIPLLELTSDSSRSEGTISYPLENISGLKTSVYSPKCLVRNLPWRIKAGPSADFKSFTFFLSCNQDSSCRAWSCKASAELRLMNQIRGKQDLVKETEHKFCSEENDWGYNKFISWKDLLDVDKGYIKNDKIIIEVQVKADELCWISVN